MYQTRTHGQRVESAVRLEALRATKLLDSLPEESLDRYTRLAAALLNSEISLISLVDRNRQYFKSQVGLDDSLCNIRETPISQSLCKHVVLEGRPLVIEDAREDPRFSDNPFVRDFGVGSYLGAPIRTRDGMILGSLCVISKKSHQWTQVDIDRLSDLACAVMREIELRELSRTLKETLVANDSMEEQERKRLAVKFDNLREPVCSVSSCTEQLAAATEDSNSWQFDLLQHCKNSAEILQRSICDILEHDLSEVGYVGPLCYKVVSASLILRKVVRLLQPFADDASVRIDLRIPDDLIFLEVDGFKIERVLIILVTNAIQCSRPEASVLIRAMTAERFGQPMCDIIVSDCCDGAPDVDKQGIFRGTQKDAPFGGKAGGMFCKKVIEAQGGEFEIGEVPGGGSAFHCWLPLARFVRSESPGMVPGFEGEWKGL